MSGQGQPPPGVPGTLRTGIAGREASVDVNSPFIQRMLALVFTMVTRAAQSAASYTEHAHRTLVTPKDVQMALKFHARHFLSEEGIEQLETDVNEMAATLQQPMSDSETDSGSGSDMATSGDEDEDDGDVEEEEAEVEPQMCDDDETWTRSECQCSACVGIHETLETWDAWTPTDPAEKWIKAHVDTAVAQSAP
jgi:hypothetical protein